MRARGLERRPENDERSARHGRGALARFIGKGNAYVLLFAAAVHRVYGVLVTARALSPTARAVRAREAAKRFSDEKKQINFRKKSTKHIDAGHDLIYTEHTKDLSGVCAYEDMHSG